MYYQEKIIRINVAVVNNPLDWRIVILIKTSIRPLYFNIGTVNDCPNSVLFLSDCVQVCKLHANSLHWISTDLVQESRAKYLLSLCTFERSQGITFCTLELQFYVPVNTVKVMLSRSETFSHFSWANLVELPYAAIQ